MLKTLSIKNYALIEELNVEFERGLNIITGETGAGKSIIIDALSLVLGERAETETVRKGAEKAVVEAVLEVAGNAKLASLLAGHEIDPGDELILRREVSVKGQSRSFINDTPVPTAVLKQAGDLLVDLHGQHEHQSLLRAETHCDLLDSYGGLEGMVEEFARPYRDAQTLLAQLHDLRAKEHSLMERRALYEFQIKEIDLTGPRSGEEEELERELVILENSERLFTATEELYQMLYEGDNAVHDQLILARNELENLSTIDPSFEEPRREAASATAIVDELTKFIQQYNSKIEFDPERLEQIRDRLGNLTVLKKKYGGSLEAVIRHREHIGKEYDLANNFQTEIASLEKRLELLRAECTRINERLSAKRHEVAKKLSKAIVGHLAELGIARALFETMITSRPARDDRSAVVRSGRDYLEATPRGADCVEFHISTNPGEDPKPLVKVASGGEISRIMLALKMILAKSDRLPLLVFDEIDVGISGRIGQAVGQSLKKLSQFHQVVSITHLPQIAGFADRHFVVEKSNVRGRSLTQMRPLEFEERVREVAKLISGADVTERGIESARELMGLT
jgi:DNA repair protein RecN (Recombination protein N)